MVKKCGKDCKQNCLYSKKKTRRELFAAELVRCLRHILDRDSRPIVC